MKEKLNQSLKNISLRQLKVLASVVRSGSTKAAADALNVTPPAITQQLQQLEAIAGLPLIERSKRQVHVTEAGQELLTVIDRIDELLAGCAESLDILQNGEGGKVHVGVISTAKYFAPRALAAFAQQHPNIEMRLAVGNREETIAGLAGFDLDFAIMGRAPETVDVTTVTIGDHPHVVIAAPDHRLASERKINLQEIKQETFLVREQGSGTRILMSRLFQDAGLSLDAAMEIGSNETIKQAVMAGLGIALISAHTVAAEIQAGRLCILDVDGLPIIRQWFIVKHQDKRLMPAAQKLWTFLAGQASDFLPSP